MRKLHMLTMTMAALLLASGAAMAGSIVPDPVSVPVPAVWVLMAAGVGALYLFRRK